MMAPRIIVIAGGSASGKTTLANMLRAEYEGQAIVISTDNYYKDQSRLSMHERRLVNYDSPEAFDFELLREHLDLLKNSIAVEMPVYDFTTHCRTSETITIQPSEIIIVEGILTLYSEEIRSIADKRIFVECDADERVIRRILRDISKRGRKLNDIVRQYRETVKPMHDIYIEPSKIYADIIIDGGNINDNIDYAYCVECV